MDFYEVEGKRLMRKYGIPADDGILLSQTDGDRSGVAFPCVVKSQFLSGKRGKAGGIKFARDAAEFEAAVDAVKSVVINGKHPDDIFIVPMLDIASEHYLGVVMDNANRAVTMLYTPFGGMEIETLASESPEKLAKFNVEETLDRELWVKETEKFKLDADKDAVIYEIAVKLLKMFYDLEAKTIEINPLVYTKKNEFVAADAKLVIDDNALFRHPDLTIIPRTEDSSASEEAQKAGLAYVELGQGGDIGVVCGGAGIGMATIDAIKFYGQTAFNFLDTGGTNREKTEAALSIVLRNPNVKGVIVNVFGGINNCLDMAEGVRDALLAAKRDGIEKPMVVKSRGFNQAEGWAIYDELGLPQVHYGTTDAAVKKLFQQMGRLEG